MLAIALLLGLLVATAPANSGAPARDRTVVGPIHMGVTTTARLQRIFGTGLMTTGHHPGSAVEWRLRSGGSFSSDGWRIGGDADISYVIDRLIWSTDPSISHHAVSITYHGIRLGEKKARVLATLGPHYRRVSAFSQTCFDWALIRPGTHEPLNIYASFAGGRLVFLAFDLADD